MTNRKNKVPWIYSEWWPRENKVTRIISVLQYWVRSLPFYLFMYLKEKQYKIAMILLCPVQGPWASSFQSLVYPQAPPPPQTHTLVTLIHTNLSLYHLFLPKWPLSNQYTQLSLFVVTNPTRHLASIVFIINCTYPYLYLWPPLTPYIHLFLHLRLFLSVLTWSETRMKRLSIIFWRIRGVPQQSEGSRKATRMKTENRYREIEIRLLLTA